MTDLDTTPPVAGWYLDPQGVGEQRFWDGSAWTEHTRGRGPGPTDEPAPVAPVESGLAPARASFSYAPVANRMATASLVLGIVALLFNVLLVPTVLGIVFGAMGIVRSGAIERSGRQAVGRARAIVGIVLASVGVLALGAQAAIAIPIVIGVTQHAKVATIESSIRNQAANDGITLTDLECPAGALAGAGSRFDCTAVTSAGIHLALAVTVTDANGDFTFSTTRTP